MLNIENVQSAGFDGDLEAAEKQLEETKKELEETQKELEAQEDEADDLRETLNRIGTHFEPYPDIPPSPKRAAMERSRRERRAALREETPYTSAHPEAALYPPRVALRTRRERQGLIDDIEFPSTYPVPRRR